MGRKLSGEKPKPATIWQRKWRKRVERGEIKAEERRREREGQPLPEGMDYRIVDCRVGFSDIADNSVALILTDPPYGNDAKSLYEWLAEFAKRVLIPGGSLICYTGNTLLDRDYRIFGKHLLAQPQAILLHNERQRLFGSNVYANFKPILWFSKGRCRDHGMVPLVIDTSKRDKSELRWSQGNAGVWQWVHHLTEPGETVLDPFSGVGLWGEITASMGRYWIGADVVFGGSTSVVADQLEAPILDEAAD